MSTTTTNRVVSVASADEPTGWWFAPARYIVTWLGFSGSAFACNITQRTVMLGKQYAVLEPYTIFAVTHRTLWDSFWFGAMIGLRNLWALAWQQSLVPMNLPDGKNFMDTPLMWLVMRLLRCLPILRRSVITTLAEGELDNTSVSEAIQANNDKTWQGIIANLESGGTLLWFTTSGRDVKRGPDGRVIDGTCVSTPIRSLGNLVLELRARGIPAKVVPVYTVNNNQTYRKTRENLPGPWHIVPAKLGIRKTLKMAVWILAQRPFRFRNRECLVAHFGPPLSIDELMASAGTGKERYKSRNIALRVGQAIEDLKPAVDAFRGVQSEASEDPSSVA